jgi:hypothetical protein
MSLLVIFNSPKLISLQPISTYYGILKYRTGAATWVKKPMKTYVSGSWQLKHMYRYDGATHQWLPVNNIGA